MSNFYSLTSSPSKSHYSSRFNLTNNSDNSSPVRISTTTSLNKDYNTDSTYNKWLPIQYNSTNLYSNSSSKKYQYCSENNNENLFEYKTRSPSRPNNNSRSSFSSTDESELEEDTKSKLEYGKLVNENNNLKKEKEVLLSENSKLQNYATQFKKVQSIIYKKGITKTQNDSMPIEEIIESIINDKNSNNDRLKRQTNELQQLKNANEQKENTIRNIQQKLYQLANIESTEESIPLDQLINKIFSAQQKSNISLKKQLLQLKKKIDANPSITENGDQGTGNFKKYIIERMKLKEESKSKTEIELIELIINHYEYYQKTLRNAKSYIAKKGQIQPKNCNKQIIQLFDDVLNNKEEEIQKLTNEVSTLNEKLTAEKERFDQELASLSIENERYRRENEKFNLYQQEKETKANSKLKPTTNELQPNLTDQIQQIQTLLISLQETKTNSEHQNSEIEAKENKIQQLIKQNEKYQQKIDDLEKLISELKTQLKNQQDLKIDEISQKSAEMKESIEKLKTIASKLNKEKKTQSPIDDDDNEEIDNDKFRQSENLKDQIDLLKEKIEGRENSISSLRNKKDKLENKLIANLEEKINDQDKLISSLNNIKHQLDELVKIFEINEIQDDDYSLVIEKIKELIDKCNQNNDHSQIQALQIQNEKLLNEIKEKDNLNASLNNDKEQFEHQQQKRRDFIDQLIEILKIDEVQDDDYSLVMEKVKELVDKHSQNDNNSQIQALQIQNEKLLNEIKEKDNLNASLNNDKKQFEHQRQKRRDFIDQLIEKLKIDEVQDDDYSPIIEKINEIIANANNNSNQSNDIKNNNNDQIENLKSMIYDLQSKISEKENNIKDLIHQKELLGRQKDSSNDLLRRHIALIQTENDKQLRRIRFLQQQEIKEIIGSDDEEDNDSDDNNKDDNNNDDKSEDDDNDLLSE